MARGGSRLFNKGKIRKKKRKKKFTVSGQVYERKLTLTTTASNFDRKPIQNKMTKKEKKKKTVNGNICQLQPANCD